MIRDQGGEFGWTLIALLEEYSIEIRVTAAHAGVQQALAERNGGIVGNLIMALCHEHSLAVVSWR